MNNAYPMAYKEVLTILDYYLNEEDYSKIPKEKIQFFKQNTSEEYKYKIDMSKPYTEQSISKEANSIIVSIYREYFVNEEEKRILDQILLLNELNEKKIKAYEEGIKEKIDIFQKEEMPKAEETALVNLENESIWRKLLNKIRRKLNKTAI